MKKIFYCVAGVISFGVIEEDIIRRENLLVKARRVFTMQQAPPMKVMGSRNEMQFIVAIYNDVTAQCDLISDLSQDSPFYKGIMEGLKEGVKPGEN